MKGYLYSFKTSNLLFVISIAFLLIIIFFFVNNEIQNIIAPVFTAIFFSIFFWFVLLNRRKELPLAEPATLTVLSIFIYTIIPPLQYLLSDMRYTLLSAYPLFIISPTPEQIGKLTWWYVVYLLSFILGYLFFDSRREMKKIDIISPGKSTIIVLIGLLSIFLSFLLFCYLMYGLNPYVTYGTAEMYDSYETYLKMPVLFRQIYGIITAGSIWILKIGILLVIFLNWKKNILYRYSFYSWIIFLFVSNIIWMGSRTDIFMTMMCSGLMYHQFVKKFKFRMILISGIALFIIFMLMGFVRGHSTVGKNINVFKNRFENPDNSLSMNNEFQALFGGSFDLLKMKQEGIIENIPLQFKYYDLIMLIPQQLLPFEKKDVQDWYIKNSPNPGYFMFNPICQSILGFGWIELIIRGILLGIIFAKLRSWYLKRSSRFWATVFYYYIITIAYYTIRGPAIYFLLASTIYRFIPLYLLIRLLSFGKRNNMNYIPVSPGSMSS